ncbi:MAG: hypothetical protein HY795_07415 [Desulfovibrio sp.]|nr:hypothetical protein [Desulfovibrio sp.]MBI4960823.1 hypothetical protein [Desulfovibrio sp.]
MDLFCRDSGELFTLITCSAFLPKAGADLKLSFPTHYLNNIRKGSSKGGRVYLKEINGHVAVRLELVFKREMVKKTCPGTLNLLNTIDAKNIFKILQFKQLKMSLIIRRYKKVFMDLFDEDVYKIFLSTFYFRYQISKDFKLGIRHVLKFMNNLLGKNAYSETHPFQARLYAALHGRHFV